MRLSVRFLGLWLILSPFFVFSQTTRSTLEFFNESLLGGTYNGPNAGVPDVRFRENVPNPTATTRQDYTPDIFVNYGYFNHQFSNASGIADGRAATFGASQNTSGTNPTGENIWQPLNASILGSPANALFTSSTTNPGGAGTGISTADNHGIIQFTSARGLQVANSSTSGRYHVADFTYRFARPVTNPVLHLAGLGDSFGTGTTKVGYTTEFDILNGGLTMTKVSGTSSLVVSNTQITNTSSIADLGVASAAGSIRVNGQNITEITFRVYLRVARGSANPSWPANTHLGDTFSSSWSFDTPIDLLIDHLVNNFTPNVGSNVVFTILASNTSLLNGQPNRPASGGRVLAVLPAGLSHVSHTAPAGTSYNPLTGIWTIGEFPSNTTHTLTITATVLARGNYDFFAAVSGDQRDPDLSNNVKYKTVTPVGALGQVTCSNVLTPFFTETFGSGGNPGAPLPAGTTNYMYEAPNQPANFPSILSDGQYVIASTSSFANTSWQAKTDRTGNANGYYMIVNADFSPGEFYRRTLTGLSPNTVYRINFWAINLNSLDDKDFCDKNEGGLISPNVGFYAVNPTSGILGSGITGNIPFESNATWKNYSFTFQTGQQSSVDLVLYNAAPGGCGNDLGIDDITVEQCGVSISGSVFNDTNGLSDNTVNGSLYAGSVPLFVSLTTPDSRFPISTVPVINGQYTFTNQVQRDYTAILYTQSGGSVLPEVPSEEWVFTGEFVGTIAGNDGSANGQLDLNAVLGSVSHANFGINARPSAGSGVATGTNPGGLVQIPFPATTFSNITLSTDAAPGLISSIQITAFPIGATSVVINGINYTASSWPINGVTIPTNTSGTPTQAISVDPSFLGAGAVTFNFRAIDNAGTTSANIGSATLNLVSTPILAVDDDLQAIGINNATGGSPGNVLTNDSLNNQPLVSSQVVTTLLSNGGVTGLTLNASGQLQVPAGSSIGLYTASYSICEVSNSTNCSEAEISFRVISTSGGGNSSTPCNAYTPLTPPIYTNLSVANSTGFFGGDNWNNKGRLIDSDINNSASWSALLLGSAWIEARDLNATGANAFPAGYYAGMVINDLDLLSLGASVRITTYLGTTEQESQTFGSLVSSLLDGGGRRRVGFITTKEFNRIRLTVNAGITLVFTINAFHAEVFKPCSGPEPICNVNTPLNRPIYASVIEPARTGLSGLALGFISNLDNVVNTNTDDFATLSLNVGVLASASVSVRNLAETFPAGYFAGFDLSNSTLLGLNLLGNVTIQTYLNGTLRQTISSNNLVLDVPILSGSDRQTVGFITNQSFNEIRLTINQPVGINLGSTRVYNAVVKQYCAGPALECNTSTSLIAPTYPVLINTNRTGIDGLACVGCSIDNPERIINASTTDFTNIVLVAGVGIAGSVSVQDPLTDYAAGTFAGFDIQNSSLLSADILNGLTIRTYLNGTLKETKSGLNDLISVGTSLLTGDGRRTVGFVTTQAFDEVRLTLTNTVSINLGTTRIYQVVLKRFCEVNLACNQTYFLKEPTAPVVVNSLRTGIDGLACVICSVENANNVISPANNDFSTITVAAGVLASGSISVLDGITTYPRGSTAGFVVEDVNNLLQLDLFNSLSICTYNNGVLQECASGGQLIDLALLVNLIGQGPGIVNVGFRTTKDFDEVRLSVNSLASVLNIIRVYSAYADTRGVTDPSFNCCPTTAPVMSTQILQNACPATSVNLNALVTSQTPPNSILVWYTGADPTKAASVVDPTQVTQSGQYFAFYFNGTNAINCFSPASVAVAVTIRACILANDDFAAPVQANVGGQNILRVRLNDTLNGAPVDSTLLSTQLVGSLPTGLVFNPGPGTVSVNPGTAVGVYTFQYRLCQLSNPTNCDTATVTVRVVQSQVQEIACSNNGTFDTSVDDFVVFKISPSIAESYSISATFEGNPVTVTQLDNSSAMNVFGGLPSYFKISNGSLGAANFQLIVAYQSGFSETVTFVNPLTCSANCPTASTGNISTHIFASPNSLTELNSTATLPKFQPSQRRVLREVRVKFATQINALMTFSVINSTNPILFSSSTRLFYTVNGVSFLDTVNLFANPSAPMFDTYPVGSYVLERPFISSQDSITYTAAGDLAQFIGPGVVDVSFATLTSTSASNVSGISQNTFAGYLYKIEYIYDCLPLIRAENDTSQAILFQGTGGVVISNIRNNDTADGMPAVSGNTNLSILGVWPSGISLNTISGLVQVDGSVMAGDFSLPYRLCDAQNPMNCDSAFVVFTVSPPPFVKLLPKVYLQGSLYGVTLPDTLMRDDLRVANRLPLNHPYNYLSPITPVSAVNASVFSVTGSNAIVDWVFVELRSALDSTVIVDSRAGLLQRDGDIVEVDGISPMQFGVATNSQSYFVAVRHRNHLGVISERPLAMTVSGLVVDFRKATTPTFRFSAATINQAQVVVNQGRALWAGNAERDNQVIYQGTINDLNPIYTRIIADPSNLFILPTFKARGYLKEDIDMNGEAVFQGTGNDLEFIYQNVISNHPGNVFILPFFTIREQLP